MFHLFLSIPAFLHSFPIAHYHNRYDMSPSYKYSTMTFDHLPYHSYYDEMGFNNYSAEDRAWRRSYYSMWHRNPWNYNPWYVKKYNGRYNNRYNNRGYHWRNRHNRRKWFDKPRWFDSYNRY